MQIQLYLLLRLSLTIPGATTHYEAHLRSSSATLDPHFDLMMPCPSLLRPL